MAEVWINCDAPRPGDTAKFARRVELLQALGVAGVRISAANSDYGLTPSSYVSTGIDAWVDLLAPTGIKCQVVLNVSFNYGHAAWIAVAGTYTVDYPSYFRPPLAIVPHLVSRDSSYWNRFVMRWETAGGRREDLAVQIGGELGWKGANAPMEAAFRAAYTALGEIGRHDTSEDWASMGFDEPYADGIIEFLEAYVPLMDWSGTKVIAPSIAGHVLSRGSEITNDTIHAAHGYTGAWPYLIGRGQAQVSDTCQKEMSVTEGLFRSVGAVPWWQTIPEGDLEWAIELYPGSEYALVPGLSPALCAEVMKRGILQRAAAMRAAVAAARAEYEGAALTNLDPNAPIHVVEWGFARGWLNGVDVHGGRIQRAQSEVEYGNIIGRCQQALASLRSVQTISLYDLENRNSAYDVPNGYDSSFGLMKSDGSVSYAAASVAAASGYRLDVGGEAPGGGAWWSETVDAGSPILH